MAGGSKHRSREPAALLLAAGRTLAETAADASVQVTVRTLSRWLLEPEFRELIEKARTESFDGTVGRLSDAAGGAVETLVSLHQGEGEGTTAATRCTAARAVLEMCFRARDMSTIEQRLAAIERKLEQEGGRRSYE
jgi:hypothetical protein